MDQVKIGRYISEKRKALGLTQAELAEKIGMSNKSVSKWERGVCLPDVSVYMELCGILGISLNEFLQGEDLEPETVEKRSEENIISVTKAGNKRSKKFQKTAAALGILVILLAAFSLTFLIREGYLGGNYLKSYDIESNASQLSRAVMPLGNVQLYEFSCDKSYKEIEISVYKKDGGRMRNKLIGSAEFPFPYDPESGKRASGKGTLVIAYYDGKLTVSGMGVCGYQAYQLELSDVIEGFDINKGARCHYAFAGKKKLVSGKKSVLYALDYGYDAVDLEQYADDWYDIDHEMKELISYEDLDDIIEDPEGILEGYNDLVFVTVIFN